jgi:hypothetical protein
MPVLPSGGVKLLQKVFVSREKSPHGRVKFFIIGGERKKLRGGNAARRIKMSAKVFDDSSLFVFGNRKTDVFPVSGSIVRGALPKPAAGRPLAGATGADISRLFRCKLVPARHGKYAPIFRLFLILCRA